MDPTWLNYRPLNGAIGVERLKMKRLSGLMVLAFALAGVLLAQSGPLINGAGATFPNPI